MTRRKHICIIIALFVVMFIVALAAFILIRNRKISPTWTDVVGHYRWILTE